MIDVRRKKTKDKFAAFPYKQTVFLFRREIFHLEVKAQFIKSVHALAITDFEIPHVIIQI